MTRLFQALNAIAIVAVLGALGLMLAAFGSLFAEAGVRFRDNMPGNLKISHIEAAMLDRWVAEMAVAQLRSE